MLRSIFGSKQASSKYSSDFTDIRDENAGAKDVDYGNSDYHPPSGRRQLRTLSVNAMPIVTPTNKGSGSKKISPAHAKSQPSLKEYIERQNNALSPTNIENLERPMFVKSPKMEEMQRKLASLRMGDDRFMTPREGYAGDASAENNSYRSNASMSSSNRVHPTAAGQLPRPGSTSSLKSPPFAGQSSSAASSGSAFSSHRPAWDGTTIPARAHAPAAAPAPAPAPSLYVYEDSSNTDDPLEDPIVSMFSKVRHNRTAAVKKALTEGTFDPTEVDDKGNTMLHVCAQNNLRKMASVVISAGCPVSEINTKGLTPLDYCHMYAFTDLSAWLVTAHKALRAVELADDPTVYAHGYGDADGRHDMDSESAPYSARGESHTHTHGQGQGHGQWHSGGSRSSGSASRSLR